MKDIRGRRILVVDAARIVGGMLVREVFSPIYAAIATDEEAVWK